MTFHSLRKALTKSCRALVVTGGTLTIRYAVWEFSFAEAWLPVSPSSKSLARGRSGFATKPDLSGHIGFKTDTLYLPRAITRCVLMPPMKSTTA